MTEGNSTAVDVGRVFDEALGLLSYKDGLYGGAWRRQGWRGNLARMMSKMERLRSMLWHDGVDLADLPVGDEGVERQLLDLMNITAMMYRNYTQGVQWGHEVPMDNQVPLLAMPHPGPGLQHHTAVGTMQFGAPIVRPYVSTGNGDVTPASVPELHRSDEDPTAIIEQPPAEGTGPRVRRRPVKDEPQA